MTVYTPISTFEDDSYKSYIRESILNPLIIQHNKMGVDITSVYTDVEKMSLSVDSIVGIEEDIANLETRVFDLEKNPGGAGGELSFTDLLDTPKHLECGKYLKVNEAGTHIDLVDIGGTGGTYVGNTSLEKEETEKYGKILCVDGTAQFINLPNIGTDAVIGMTPPGVEITISNSNLDAVTVNAPVKLEIGVAEGRQHIRMHGFEYHELSLDPGQVVSLVSYEDMEGLKMWQVFSITDSLKFTR